MYTKTATTAGLIRTPYNNSRGLSQNDKHSAQNDRIRRPIFLYLQQLFSDANQTFGFQKSPYSAYGSKNKNKL